MAVDMPLFLQNVRAALANQQYQHAKFLVEYAINLAKDQPFPSTQVPPFDVSIGLHQGRIRDKNEDCVLVVQGVRPSHDSFGLFVVCDGMGGHVRGQEAAHLAIQTILKYILPHLENNATPPSWESLFVEGIQQANRAIYLQNQLMEQELAAERRDTSQQMGTTMTAVLLFREVAYIANVGDSRTYLYNQSLQKITKDHSLVAQLFADGLLQEEDIYTHPQRNRITRALGVNPSVEVDTFVVPLHGEETLLLCSDGLWEMTRDQKIEEVLATRESTTCMAGQLVRMANDGGGKDNIGCIVVRLQQRTDVGLLETLVLEPVAARKRVISAS